MNIYKPLSAKEYLQIINMSQKEKQMIIDIINKQNNAILLNSNFFQYTFCVLPNCENENNDIYNGEYIENLSIFNKIKKKFLDYNINFTISYDDDKKNRLYIATFNPIYYLTSII